MNQLRHKLGTNQSTPKSELNFDDWSNKMLSIMKNIKDNNVINLTGVIFAKYDTKLS